MRPPIRRCRSRGAPEGPNQHLRGSSRQSAIRERHTYDRMSVIRRVLSAQRGVWCSEGEMNVREKRHEVSAGERSCRAHEPRDALPQERPGTSVRSFHRAGHARRPERRPGVSTTRIRSMSRPRTRQPRASFCESVRVQFYHCERNHKPSAYKENACRGSRSYMTAVPVLCALREMRCLAFVDSRRVLR